MLIAVPYVALVSQNSHHIMLSLSSQHGRQREFLVRERATKDGFYALSIRYHYRSVLNTERIVVVHIDPTHSILLAVTAKCN